MKSGNAAQRQHSQEGIYLNSNIGSLSVQKGVTAGGMSARWAGKSSGSQCRKSSHAAYQNQQHLQLQTQKKLMSRVHDFQSQFLNNKEPNQLHQTSNVRQDASSGILVSHSPDHADDSKSAMNETNANRYSRLVPVEYPNQSKKLQTSSAIGRVRDLSAHSSPLVQNRPRITNEVQS